MRPSARPSLSRRDAWLFLVTAVLVAWGLTLSFMGRSTPRPAGPGGGASDLRLYEAVTATVAGGQDYYPTLARELPARGYATQSVLNWRLPTLVWFNAALPQGRVWRTAPIAMLGFGAIFLWLAVVRVRAPRAAGWGMPALFMSVPAFLHPQAADMHELWAGLLIAVSVGAWALGWRAAAVAAGCAALFIRELAAPFALVMALLAWRESARREAAAWSLVLLLFSAFFAWHVSQVAPHIPAGGTTRSWLSFQGWSFVLATSYVNALLHFLPAWVAAVLVPAAWAGLWRWQDPVGLRLAITVTIYFAVFMIAGRPDNWYWGLIVAPLLPLGLFGWYAKPSVEP
jgi:hypothetical protein